MSFLGLEKPVEYGHFLAFDPRMALMVLNAYGDYINAARQDYLLGQEEVKDFLSKYGDFTSPIEKDVENWNNITINPLNKLLDEAYANGIDPLRNREFRNRLLAQARSVNGADLAKLKLSAEIAREFVKERSKLEALGLYNPIYAKYDGPDITKYDTLKDGIWQKTSPTPIQNMAVFTKDYFDGLKPFTRSASKNGISYTKSEITELDLYNIAASRFNDLVNTPQGRLMYLMYLDLTGDPNAAKDMFNASVVSGNMKRLFYKDDYNEQRYKAATLSLQREKLNFDKQKHRMEHPELYKGRSDIPPGEEGFSWTGRVYETALANAASNGSAIYSFKDIPESYGMINNTIGLTQIDFGKQFVGKYNISENEFNNRKRKLSQDFQNGLENDYTYRLKLNMLNNQRGGYDKIKKAYLDRFSTKEDELTFVAWHGGDTHPNNKSVIMASEFDINKLFDEDDVITSTMGYTKKHRGDTLSLRNKYLFDESGDKKDLKNVTITPLGLVYGAVEKQDGAFHVRMRVRVTDGKKSDVCYYDMGVRSAKRNKGAYQKDIKSSDLYYMDGSLIAPRKAFSGMSQEFVPVGIPNVDFNFKRNPNAVLEKLNMYPDYSIWGEYGPADIRANSYLKAKATQYNSGY